jgi:hypothetical protein
MIGSPSNRRLPRASRKLIKHLLSHKGHHRATELRAAAGELDHSVRSQTEHVPMPVDPGDRLTQRVRIGTETRILLRRLLEARSLRVQRALVREFRQDIANRIALHIRRSERIAAARAKARAAARLTVRMAKSAPGRARDAKNRLGRTARPAVTLVRTRPGQMANPGSAPSRKPRRRLTRTPRAARTR